MTGSPFDAAIFPLPSIRGPAATTPAKPARVPLPGCGS